MSNQPEEQFVDPEEVQELVEELLELELTNPRQFTQALADNCMRSKPDPAETAAFRSDALAEKSLASAMVLISSANQAARRERKGSEKQKQIGHFIRTVGRERTILENRVAGIKALRGELSNKPNPRGRAMKRLWEENMAGDVPKGRYKELLIEEQEREEERKRQEKEKRRRARQQRARRG